MTPRERPAAGPRRRASNGAFHDYVRSVFAECSARARALRAGRASWLQRLSRLPEVRIRGRSRASPDWGRSFDDKPRRSIP